jgi:hypothetical protein
MTAPVSLDPLGLLEAYAAPRWPYLGGRPRVQRGADFVEVYQAFVHGLVLNSFPWTREVGIAFGYSRRAGLKGDQTRSARRPAGIYVGQGGGSCFRFRLVTG